MASSCQSVSQSILVSNIQNTTLFLLLDRCDWWVQGVPAVVARYERERGKMGGDGLHAWRLAGSTCLATVCIRLFSVLCCTRHVFPSIWHGKSQSAMQCTAAESWSTVHGILFYSLPQVKYTIPSSRAARFSPVRAAEPAQNNHPPSRSRSQRHRSTNKVTPHTKYYSSLLYMASTLFRAPGRRIPSKLSFFQYTPSPPSIPIRPNPKHQRPIVPSS